MAATPPERAGSAASLNETSGEGGIALGVAMLGSLGTFAYQRSLEVPAGLPDGVAEQARQSVTAAVVAAGQLPGQLGEDLASAAKAAFTTGLDVVAVVGAVVFVACAVMAAIRLRTTEESAEAPVPERAAEPV
jgi:DHA2 family multidrug resistance protein-like MFS transporter